MKLIFFTLAVLFLSGCPQKSGLLFYEVVHERADCRPYCSLEFIVLSDGTMLRKEALGSSNEFDGHQVGLVKISEEKAIEAIRFVEQSGLEQGGERCSGCSEFHVFFLKDKKPVMFLTEEEKAPSSIFSIMENSKKIFSQGEQGEDFFAQFVFKRFGRNAVDYHFFPSGVVLREEFSEPGSRLFGAELSELSLEKNNALKSKIAPGFFGSVSGLANCQKAGLEYGYLEIKKNGSYDFVWTCGTESSAADQLFNDLLKEFG